MDEPGLNPGVSDSQACLTAFHSNRKMEYAFSPSGVIQGVINQVMRMSELGFVQSALGGVTTQRLPPSESFRKMLL